jgi:hypothetical protein
MREVARAVKAAQAAGVEVGRVEIDVDGKIVIVAHLGTGGDSPKRNTADAVLERLKHEHGK